MCRRTEEEVVPTVGLPNAIFISQGSLTCPSYTDTGPPSLYGDYDTPPHLVAFHDTVGLTDHDIFLRPGCLLALTLGLSSAISSSVLWSPPVSSSIIIMSINYISTLTTASIFHFIFMDNPVR